tara:strand:- start:11559 stop:12017 length:459 start_codon:yes stop_codon:yes gene_type:complete
MAELHIFLPTHTQMHFSKLTIGLVTLCWRAVMKFNPKMHSVLIAFNHATPDLDLLMISKFYTGFPMELVGYWKGVAERSYQLDIKHIDLMAMEHLLVEANQDAFIYISAIGKVYEKDVYNFSSNIGTMQEIPSKVDNCTYCPSTQTYWTAIL